MSDELVVSTLVFSFALLLTSHIAIVAGLLARRPRFRAPVAFLIAPLAPYWAYREGLRTRAFVWVIGALGYASARLLSAS